MNNEFIAYVEQIRSDVHHVNDIPSVHTTEDSDRILRSIAKIGAVVKEGIDLFFPDKQLSDEDCAAVLRLEQDLKALRGRTMLELAAIQKFEKMAQGAAN